MAYNIQMNYYDGNSYQELNPTTLLNNVSDWKSNIYNKTEVDNNIQSINNNLTNQINTINENIVNINDNINNIQEGTIIPWQKVNTKHFDLQKTTTNGERVDYPAEQFIPGNYFSYGEDLVLVIDNFTCNGTITTTQNHGGSTHVVFLTNNTNKVSLFYYSINYTSVGTGYNDSHVGPIVLTSLYSFNSLMIGYNSTGFGNNFPFSTIGTYIDNEKLLKNSFSGSGYALNNFLALNQEISIQCSIYNNDNVSTTLKTSFNLSLYKRPSILTFKN